MQSAQKEMRGWKQTPCPNKACRKLMSHHASPAQAETMQAEVLQDAGTECLAQCSLVQLLIEPCLAAWLFGHWSGSAPFKGHFGSSAPQFGLGGSLRGLSYQDVSECRLPSDEITLL